MKLQFSRAFADAMQEAKCKTKQFHKEHRYGSLTIDASLMDPDDFKIAEKLMKNSKLSDDTNCKRLIRQWKSFTKMKDVGAGKMKIKANDLRLLPTIIRDVVAKLPHHYVFMADNQYGWFLPYLVKGAKYVEASRGSPAHVTMSLTALRRGKHETHRTTFYRGDLIGGTSVDKLLVAAGIMLETPEMLKEYYSDLKLYKAYAEQTGEQFLGSGQAHPYGERRWYRTEAVSLETDGKHAKLVMDDMIEQGDDEAWVNSDFSTTDHDGYNMNIDDDDDYDDDDDEEEDDEENEDEETNQTNYRKDEDGNTIWEVPTHAIMRMFVLDKHQFVTVYVGCIKPYEYNEKLIHKLVLPEDHKFLVDALTGAAIERMSDIVAGKAQGVIVMCSGTPGTGKTLTAEVYSEVAKRPLYMVQCSQLGTNDEALEEKLGEVLSRATRWRAILLIDESDVYIHERGDDIQQNAIVGVFLRLLEYYNGILFLTTNRETEVDDAIKSRVTAHIRYGVPAGDDRNRLWKIMSDQYGVGLTDKEIAACVAVFPHISGRSIRQLIRLALFMAKQKGVKFETHMLKDAAKFHDFNEEEKYNHAS
jgi:hypothetical protein